MALDQDNLNLPLRLHLNTSSLRELSSRLGSLKLIIHFFSAIQKLHLLLKLFAVEDCLTIFYFIWGVSIRSLRSQKYLDRDVWFRSRWVEKCLWLSSRCSNSPRRYLYKLSPHHYYVPGEKCALGIRRSPSYTVHPRDNPLGKPFNRSSVKMSYSCINNMYSILNNHNRRLHDVLNRNSEMPDKVPCNCRKKKNATRADDATRRTPYIKIRGNKTADVGYVVIERKQSITQ